MSGNTFERKTNRVAVKRYLHEAKGALEQDKDTFFKANKIGIPKELLEAVKKEDNNLEAQLIELIKTGEISEEQQSTEAMLARYFIHKYKIIKPDSADSGHTYKPLEEQDESLDRADDDESLGIIDSPKDVRLSYLFGEDSDADSPDADSPDADSPDADSHEDSNNLDRVKALLGQMGMEELAEASMLLSSELAGRSPASTKVVADTPPTNAKFKKTKHQTRDIIAFGLLAGMVFGGLAAAGLLLGGFYLGFFALPILAGNAIVNIVASSAASYLVGALVGGLVGLGIATVGALLAQKEPEPSASSTDVEEAQEGEAQVQDDPLRRSPQTILNARESMQNDTGAPHNTVRDSDDESYESTRSRSSSTASLK